MLKISICVLVPRFTVCLVLLCNIVFIITNGKLSKHEHNENNQKTDCQTSTWNFIVSVISYISPFFYSSAGSFALGGREDPSTVAGGP